MESYIKAKLTSLNKLNVLIFTGINKREHFDFVLYKDNEVSEKLSILKQSFQNNIHMYELTLKTPYEFGHNYSLYISEFPMVNIDVSSITELKNFDELFYYDGDDLGATYSKEETSFALWAPLASTVILTIETEYDGFCFYKMNRTEKGVYRTTIKGDYKNKKYHYLVTNSGVTRETNDPYGKGVSLNSLYSVVVDLNEVNEIEKVTPTNKIENYVDSIIYEVNVRDFTEHNGSTVENKGKFLGLVEENKTTKKGKRPVALDYLKYLGITHIQLQPVLDFRGVDDVNVSKSYNWGYDPISLFVIEGSYSIKPDIAISRLKELKQMVATLHKNNIRVNVDVVYNHIYDYMSSSLEKVVPNYYFRRRENGQIANASGCGNDIKSERKMVSKMIVDSLTYLLKTFDFDGFRFDLMGLLDVDTINAAYKKCKEIKNDIMFYGEGWDMGYELPKNKKAAAYNYALLPNVAFFNDTFRNVMDGSVFKDRIKDKGYVAGNVSLTDDLNYIFHASCVDVDRKKARFDNANRSINYVECHDNLTLFDKLSASNEEENEETILRRIKFANKLLMLSFGVPFIHMGQEIGQSKGGNDNTYNVTKVNNFDFNLFDERFEMATSMKMYIELRKSLNYVRYFESKDVKETFKVDYWHNNVYCLELAKAKYSPKYPKLLLLVNNENYNKQFELDDYYTYIVGDSKIKAEAVIKNNFVASNSISVLTKKGENK